MKWLDFRGVLEKKRVLLFSSRNARAILGVPQKEALVTMHRWAKRGLIHRLRRDLYALGSASLSDPYVANKLYEPSYISLEFALSYYGIIPESVYAITSITPRSPKRFEVQGKAFTYRHIKKTAYAGYQTRQQQGLTFYIAEPEKAFVDLLYFRVLSRQRPLSRFSKARLNKDRALHFAKMFKNKKLTSIVLTTLR